jgi:hypothetical protein
MLIEVIRSDNRCDSVEDSMLDELIATKDVVKFKRGTKWVTLGAHPTKERKQEMESKDKDGKAASDCTFESEYRDAYSSSLEPF